VRARAVVFWLAVSVLLVPAAALTFDRVVEPDRGFWIQLEAFTPFGIVLYGAALLAVLVRLLVRHRWHSVGSVVAVVAATGLVVHCWWFAPQLTGSSPPPAAEATTLTVMSANLSEGGADGVEVVQRASDERVDLLVLEEVTAAVLADMDRAGLGELFPYRVGRPNTGADGTMVFSRQELGAAERVPTLHDGWVVTVGELTVLAVHPSAPTVPDAWRDDLATVVATAARVHPDLVVGDFNATADHPPMRALADLGYRDVGELANQGWQPSWPSSGARDVLGVPVPSLVQIDHVLVGTRMAAVSMRTALIPDSDHRAVIAEVAAK
jgi:endonuclease/exonuclease/phosphatase (EEP) superfamily protein YafD